MLENLNIKNFRLFEDFTISKLGRVNLLVGENNSGKSTVLEALRIYAMRGNPYTLLEIAKGHDELPDVSTINNIYAVIGETSLFKDFFHGRKYPAGDNEKIYIGNKEQSLFLSIAYLYLNRPDPADTVPKDITGDATRLGQVLRIGTHEGDDDRKIQIGLPMSPYAFWPPDIEEIPCGYVPTQILSMDSLAQHWDDLLFTSFEEEVKSILNILDNNFEELAFVNTKDNVDFSASMRPRSHRSAVVKLKNISGGIPLASMGDGMSRILQLILNIFPAKGGILLIDEFENGLHWSVQEKVWKMIFKLAHDLDIQVFATTHSKDAVEAFNKVANEEDDEGVLIELVGIKEDGKNKTVAVVYDEKTLKTALETGTEVR